MGKNACKKEGYQEPAKPAYKCKKCGLTAEKEKQLCKPKEVKGHGA